LQPLRITVVFDEQNVWYSTLAVKPLFWNAIKALAGADKGANREGTNIQMFAAKAVREWLSKIGVQTLFIEPGSPWENGYI
jgi:hypothetical protein